MGDLNASKEALAQAIYACQGEHNAMGRLGAEVDAIEATLDKAAAQIEALLGLLSVSNVDIQDHVNRVTMATQGHGGKTTLLEGLNNLRAAGREIDDLYFALMSMKDTVDKARARLIPHLERTANAAAYLRVAKDRFEQYQRSY